MSFMFWKNLLSEEVLEYKELFSKLKGIVFWKSVLKKIRFSISIMKRIILYPNTKRRKTLKFELHLTTHCNLNCKGCNTFSSIAQEGFASFDQIKADLNRISKIANKRIITILLAGGEPLLHPQLIEIMNYIHKEFSYVSILYIISNAVLLMQQKDEFWEACKKNNFILFITKYPIGLPYDKIVGKAKEKGVCLKFMDNSALTKKKFRKVPINLEGTENAKYSFSACSGANNCITIKEGKIYPCSLIPRIEIFNQFFSENLVVSEKDSIDIYKADNLDEILDFLCKPVPFCRYCSVKKPVFGLNWGITEKDINEWV